RPVVLERELVDRNVAARAHCVEHRGHRLQDLGVHPARRARERGAALGRRERGPDDSLHSRLAGQVGFRRLTYAEQQSISPAYSIIFSIGRTRIAEAPAALSRSKVSQNTDSWQTACTATASLLPASGMMVGAPAPGRSSVMASSADLGALSMMYFAPFVATT